MWETWFDPWVGKIWRREVLPTPVFWPGEFHGPNSSWGHKELDITKWLSLHFTMSYYLWIFSICLTLDKYLLLSFTCSLILSLNYYRFFHGVLFLSKPKSHPWAWCQDLSLPISAALTITPFTPAKGNNFFSRHPSCHQGLSLLPGWKCLHFFSELLRILSLSLSTCHSSFWSHFLFPC